MSHRAPIGLRRRLLARLRTGSAAHLLGGGLDLLGAFARVGLLRLRRARKAKEGRRA